MLLLASKLIKNTFWNNFKIIFHRNIVIINLIENLYMQGLEFVQNSLSDLKCKGIKNNVFKIFRKC